MIQIVGSVFKGFILSCIFLGFVSTAMAVNPEVLFFEEGFIGGAVCPADSLPEVLVTQKDNDVILKIKYDELPVYGSLATSMSDGYRRAYWSRCNIDLKVALPVGKKIVLTELNTEAKVSALEPEQSAGARTYVSLDWSFGKNVVLANGGDREQVISHSQMDRLESFCIDEEMSKNVNGYKTRLRITSDPVIDRSRSNTTERSTSLVSVNLKMKIESCEEKNGK